ncbi:hypothetical protein [Cohnella faecalis]|uniref:hypothetical protein n=1 Tax=Cohnella faecalis TaxID=2315694 RepID=UPI001F415AE1|nr:hypothetical protein [Cohnella faecalis]
MNRKPILTALLAERPLTAHRTIDWSRLPSKDKNRWKLSQAQGIPSFHRIGGGGGGRGGWDGAKPKRTSFRGIFSAFMVGVVAVGGLMFAADRGNWFGNETYVSNASTQNSGVKAASTTVNNAADVVSRNNIAKIFEQSSPASVKIETYTNVRTKLAEQ